MEEHKVTIKEKARWYDAVEKLLKMGFKTEDNSAEVLIWMANELVRVEKEEEPKRKIKK